MWLTEGYKRLDIYVNSYYLIANSVEFTYSRGDLLKMRLSREKINHISHLITHHLAKDESVTLLRDENDVRLDIMNVILNELEIDDKVDTIVRRRLDSYSRKMAEGTNEWNIMYQKLYEEEMNKLDRL